jgi:hypothetical protein
MTSIVTHLRKPSSSPKTSPPVHPHYNPKTHQFTTQHRIKKAQNKNQHIQKYTMLTGSVLKQNDRNSFMKKQKQHKSARTNNLWLQNRERRAKLTKQFVIAKPSTKSKTHHDGERLGFRFSRSFCTFRIDEERFSLWENIWLNVY